VQQREPTVGDWSWRRLVAALAVAALVNPDSAAGLRRRNPPTLQDNLICRPARDLAP
jgi:hypothetical protein